MYYIWNPCSREMRHIIKKLTRGLELIYIRVQEGLLGEVTLTQI